MTLSQPDLNGRVIAALELSGLKPSLIGLSDRAPLQVTIDADGKAQHLRVMSATSPTGDMAELAVSSESS